MDNQEIVQIYIPCGICPSRPLPRPVVQVVKQDFQINWAVEKAASAYFPIFSQILDIPPRMNGLFKTLPMQ
jgi:hypothetical protein